jgi:hypothetical protein
VIAVVKYNLRKSMLNKYIILRSDLIESQDLDLRELIDWNISRKRRRRRRRERRKSDIKMNWASWFLPLSLSLSPSPNQFFSAVVTLSRQPIRSEERRRRRRRRRRRKRRKSNLLFSPEMCAAGGGGWLN